MPNLWTEQQSMRVVLRWLGTRKGGHKMIARLLLLTGAAAALSFAATAARAEVYVSETDVVAAGPSYVYDEPSYVAEDDLSLPRERIVRERIIREEVLPARERVIR